MSAENEFCDDFAAALSADVASAALDCFLLEHPGVSCLFGSQDDWARGRHEVSQAIEAVVTHTPKLTVRFTQVEAHQIGSVSSVVSGQMSHEWTELGVSLKKTSRFNLVLLQQGRRLLCLHFAEAPIAPLIELQQFYQGIAQEGHLS